MPMISFASTAKRPEVCRKSDLGEGWDRRSIYIIGLSMAFRPNLEPDSDESGSGCTFVLGNVIALPGVLSDAHYLVLVLHHRLRCWKNHYPPSFASAL